MSVSVRLPNVLRAHAGGAPVVEVDGQTIGQVLSALVISHPGLSGQVIGEDGSLNKFVNIYVNDDDVRYLQQLETPVTDGDEISILPAVAGGSR
jgi:MoaD family protein